MINKELFLYAVERVYKINVNVYGGGTVSVPKTARANETVVVMLSPNSGHILDSIKSYDVDLSYVGENSYTFIMPSNDITINVSFKEHFITIVDIYYEGNAFFDLYIQKEGGYYHSISCTGNGLHRRATFDNLVERVGDIVECWYTSQLYNLINVTSSGATKIGGTGKPESPLRFRITDKNSSLEFRFKIK